MKPILTVLALGLLTTACASEIQENRELRSTIYRGQTTWDMYENFGAPQQAVRVSPNEVHFIYRREEVTRDWTQMYFDWCDMVVMTVDDRVVDWDLTGNQCFLNVADDVEPEEAPERVNPLEQYQVVSETADDETYADDEDAVADMNPYAIGPDDDPDSLL